MGIILASASPRRSEILENLKIPFQKRTSSIDESNYKMDNPLELVKILAYEKARSVRLPQDEDLLIIGADTIVVLGQTILGKPKNAEEATTYLKLLSGKAHSVYTGLAMIKSRDEALFLDYCETKVFMRSYRDEEIKAYIQTKEPMDKAGAYGIQGFGAALVEKIEGDYYNVVGLPISKLIEGFQFHGMDYFDSYHP
ncbi:MAG: septum formation inhibitor Maf [Vallitaleaceae bacterium]|nr:septum formation inhibitor Maf [Vallitaleaceae bacterium]